MSPCSNSMLLSQASPKAQGSTLAVAKGCLSHAVLRCNHWNDSLQARGAPPLKVRFVDSCADTDGVDYTLWRTTPAPAEPVVSNRDGGTF